MKIRMTYDLAHRAATDAANARMRAAGRTHWNTVDAEVARRTLDRLYPVKVQLAEQALTHARIVHARAPFSS